MKNMRRAFQVFRHASQSKIDPWDKSLNYGTVPYNTGQMVTSYDPISFAPVLPGNRPQSQQPDE